MNRDGEDITCYFVCEDNFAGDPDSFLSQQPSDKNMQALTDCVLIGITYDNYKEMGRVLRAFQGNQDQKSKSHDGFVDAAGFSAASGCAH
jgi:hypothetical protein